MRGERITLIILTLSMLALACGERQDYGPPVGLASRSAIPQGYYDTVDDSTAAALRQTLHAAIDDHQRFPYSSTATDTWNILEDADEDPGDSGYILDVYRNAIYVKVGGGTGSYNREHTWPSSYGFPNDNASNYPYSDCHHLFLSDSGYNSSRSNKPFGPCDASCLEKTTLLNHGRGGGSGVYPGNSNWTTGTGATGTWQTWGGRRGDMARALLYLDVRYEGGTHGVTGKSEPDLRLTDDTNLIDASHTGSNESVAYMGRLATLLQWHTDDPVDTLESRRNDVVYGYQGNRNPFIDHPEWVACLFQGNCGGSGAPSASFLAPTSGETVSGTRTVRVDAWDIEDATGTLLVEVSVDNGAWQVCPNNSNGGAYELAWDTTVVADGAHTLDARATDSDSNMTHAASVNVTVQNQAPPAIHVGDLDGLKLDAKGGWTAQVTVAVHDAAHAPSAGVLVSGTWSNGASGGASCTTDGSGTCAVQTGKLKGSVPSATFSVGTLTLSGATHDQAADHDPDGDSDGISITVLKEGEPPPPPPPPTGTAHCADLDVASASAKGGWIASVTVTVHDDSHLPVSGAQVSASWISGANGGGSCTTDGAGECVIQSGKIKSNKSSATLQVIGITASGLSYQAADNHDPDGDSDGTTVSITAP